MRSTGRRAGPVLAAGLGLVLIAALTPAGMRNHEVPHWSWLVWSAAIGSAIGVFRAAGLPAVEGLRRLAALLPFVLLLAVPAGLLAPRGFRTITAIALGVRALAAAAAGAAVATLLGPSGVVSGVRQIGAPRRLVDILEATLVSLATLVRQVKSMLRAREARRPSFGAWTALWAAPVDTLRAFGRFAAVLLLRSLERAETLEQARRARGGGEA